MPHAAPSTPSASPGSTTVASAARRCAALGRSIHLAAALALGAGAAAQAGAAMPDLPVPGDAAVASLGDDLQLNGMPARLREFHTRQTRPEIVGFYRSHLQRLTDAPRLAAGDTDVVTGRLGGTLVTAVVSDTPDGGARVRLMQSTPGAPRRTAPSLPPRSRLLTQVDSIDDGRAAALLVFTNQAGLEANVAFVRDALARQAGLRLIESTDLSRDGRQGRWLRLGNAQGGEAEMTVWNDPAGQTVVLQTLQPAAPAPSGATR